MLNYTSLARGARNQKKVGQGRRLKLEGETENMGVCTKERNGMTAEVLIATPCTESLGEKVGWDVKSGAQAERGRVCFFYEKNGKVEFLFFFLV